MKKLICTGILKRKRRSQRPKIRRRKETTSQILTEKKNQRNQNLKRTLNNQKGRRKRLKNLNKEILTKNHLQKQLNLAQF